MMFVSDLDDTLYREIDFVESGLREIGRRLENAGVISYDRTQRIFEMAPDVSFGFDNLAAAIAESGGDTSYDVAWMLDVYRYHQPDISLRRGVESTLETLRAKAVKIGIITDGRSRTQRAKIKALGLDRFVNDTDIIISQETGADKNSDLPFRMLMERHPNETQWLYIGDNPAKDFRWPNHLGWITVQLLDDGHNIKRPSPIFPEDYQAQYRIKDFSEVLKFFD